MIIMCCTCPIFVLFVNEFRHYLSWKRNGHPWSERASERTNEGQRPVEKCGCSQGCRMDMTDSWCWICCESEHWGHRPVRLSPLTLGQDVRMLIAEAMTMNRCSCMCLCCAVLCRQVCLCFMIHIDIFVLTQQLELDQHPLIQLAVLANALTGM